MATAVECFGIDVYANRLWFGSWEIELNHMRHFMQVIVVDVCEEMVDGEMDEGTRDWGTNQRGKPS